MGASNAALATARAGGYDIYNGTTWETTTDITDIVDPYTSNAVVDTVAKAEALLDTGAGVTTGYQLPVAAKLATWVDVTDSVINADNDVVDLCYNITGTTINIPIPTALTTSLGRVSSGGALTGYDLKVSSLVADEQINTLSITGALTVTANCLSGAGTKVALISDSSITLPNGDYNDVEITAPTVSFRPRTGHSNVTINGASTTISLQTGVTGDFDNIFGTGFSVGSSGAELAVTSTSATTITMPVGVTIVGSVASFPTGTRGANAFIMNSRS